MAQHNLRNAAGSVLGSFGASEEKLPWEKRNLYFCTVITRERRRILTRQLSRNLLRNVLRDVKQRYPFSIKAWVLLPDHIHTLWQLPEHDQDVLSRWALIKEGFDRYCQLLSQNDVWWRMDGARDGVGGVWESKCLQRQVQSTHELKAFIDYIHFDPVKHGLVERPAEWPYSTFKLYVRKGIYTDDWSKQQFLCA